MPSSISFFGKKIYSPGAYTKVDASGLEQTNLASSGIVAILGTAVGGVPAGQITQVGDLMRVNQPAQANALFKSGDLLEAIPLLFNPSTDPNVAGGAQEVICMKVDPSTQSSANLQNSSGNVILLTSVDYGVHTEQISVLVTDASAGETGYLVSIKYEDLVEAVDGIGGDPVASLTYNASAETWDTVTAAVGATGVITVTGSVTYPGRDTDAVNAWGGASVVTVVATAADADKTIRIYGISAGSLTVEDIVLVNGSAVGTTSFTDVVGAWLDEAAEGTVTIQNAATDARFVFSASDQTKGGTRTRAFFAGNTALTFAKNVAGTENVYVFASNANGSNARETVALTGTMTVDTTITPYRVEFISVVDLANATDALYVTGTVAQTSATQQVTMQDAKVYFDARQESVDDTVYGFSWTHNIGQITKPLTEFDVQSGLLVANYPTAGVVANFLADTYEIINWINNNSTVITAELASGATKVPPLSSTSSIYLSGGTQGTPLYQDWLDALNLLKGVRVNTIVPLTGDTSVHAAVEAHCAYMGGLGRNERDAVCGAVQVDGAGSPTVTNGAYTLATKAQLKAQILALNSRHVRLVGQRSARFNSLGVKTWYEPWFTACLVAGMQAGTPVGVSLTHKQVSVLDFSQHSGWNPIDDAEEMIQSGLLFMESVPLVGSRWKRNITTYLQTDNIAFSEASVNEAVNYATYNFRTSLEAAVGEPGFLRTTSNIRARAMDMLNKMVQEGIIVSWRSLSFDLNADVLAVSVELAPVAPINFVPTVVHLATVSETVS